MKTVGELIEELQKYPKDMGIVRPYSGSDEDEYTYIGIKEFRELEVLQVDWNRSDDDEFASIAGMRFSVVEGRKDEIKKILVIT